MSQCSSCGCHSCSCNNYGCVGNLVMMLCTIAGIILAGYLLLFLLPGIAAVYLGSTVSAEEFDYANDAVKDHRVWVLSAVFWVASGIGYFWWKTRIPESE